MAAELSQEPDLKVQKEKGGLGELSVSVEGTPVYEGNRLWYPTPTGVLSKVRKALGK